MTYRADTAHVDQMLADLTATGAHHVSQPIDLVYLNRTTFADKALAQEVLSLFRSSAADYLEGLRIAQTAKDWFDAAHSLKGSAKAVGAFRLAEAAAVAEQIAGAPLSNAQKQALLDLERELTDVDQFIGETLALS